VRLFLVQHGEAKSELEDPERPLSETGTANARKMAAWLAGKGDRPAKIWHSGKKRAQQTAEIFAERLRPPGGVLARTGLKPNDDVVPVAYELDEIREPLMIAGHLPFLSRLAGRLVTGDETSVVVRFRNAGVVCLMREEGLWLVDWIVVPYLVE